MFCWLINSCSLKGKDGGLQARKPSGVLPEDSRAIADAALKLGEKRIVDVQFSNPDGLGFGGVARLYHCFSPWTG